MYKCLEKVINRLNEKNLLIKYKKSIWLSDSIVWCDRRLLFNRVGYDKKQLQGFIQMDYPINNDSLI